MSQHVEARHVFKHDSTKFMSLTKPSSIMLFARSRTQKLPDWEETLHFQGSQSTSPGEDEPSQAEFLLLFDLSKSLSKPGIKKVLPKCKEVGLGEAPPLPGSQNPGRCVRAWQLLMHPLGPNDDLIVFMVNLLVEPHTKSHFVCSLQIPTMNRSKPFSHQISCREERRTVLLAVLSLRVIHLLAFQNQYIPRVWKTH